MISVNKDGGVVDKEIQLARATGVWTYIDPRFYQFRGAYGEAWLGPVNDCLGWGSSPYMDWYNEQFYFHNRARLQ